MKDNRRFTGRNNNQSNSNPGADNFAINLVSRTSEHRGRNDNQCFFEKKGKFIIYGAALVVVGIKAISTWNNIKQWKKENQ